MPALSTKSAFFCWVVLGALLAFGLYVDWRLYFRKAERFSEVLFEWAGFVLIYGALLILPQLLRGA